MIQWWLDVLRDLLAPRFWFGLAAAGSLGVFFWITWSLLPWWGLALGAAGVVLALLTWKWKLARSAWAFVTDSETPEQKEQREWGDHVGK